jgi:hypothetical protein
MPEWEGAATLQGGTDRARATGGAHEQPAAHATEKREKSENASREDKDASSVLIRRTCAGLVRPGGRSLLLSKEIWMVGKCSHVPSIRHGKLRSFELERTHARRKKVRKQIFMLKVRIATVYLKPTTSNISG